MRGVITHLYQNYGLAGAGLIFFLEGIGVPIPVEIPLGITGLRMVQGLNSFWEIVLLMWLTTVAGNTTGYFLGYYGGRPLALKMVGWFRIKVEIWNKIETWFQRHGLKLVVVTRWINWGFAQNMWLSGITRVPFWRFFAVMVFNDFLWAIAWTWVALTAMRYFRRSFDVIHHSLIKFSTFAAGVALVGLGLYLIYRYVQRRRAERARGPHP